MAYVIVLVLWGVFAWYQLVRPSLTHARQTLERDDIRSFEHVDDTDRLIARLDSELSEGETP